MDFWVEYPIDHLQNMVEKRNSIDEIHETYKKLLKEYA